MRRAQDALDRLAHLAANLRREVLNDELGVQGEVAQQVAEVVRHHGDGALRQRRRFASAATLFSQTLQLERLVQRPPEHEAATAVIVRRPHRQLHGAQLTGSREPQRQASPALTALVQLPETRLILVQKEREDLLAQEILEVAFAERARRRVGEDDAEPGVGRQNSLRSALHRPSQQRAVAPPRTTPWQSLCVIVPHRRQFVPLQPLILAEGLRRTKSFAGGTLEPASRSFSTRCPRQRLRRERNIGERAGTARVSLPELPVSVCPRASHLRVCLERTSKKQPDADRGESRARQLG